VFDEYQMVRLKRPMGGLPAGTLGTIVMAYPGVPTDYEVEFCDPEGVTLALLTLHDEDLDAAPELDQGRRCV
jgi:hypothetical protein